MRTINHVIGNGDALVIEDICKDEIIRKKEIYIRTGGSLSGLGYHLPARYNTSWEVFLDDNGEQVLVSLKKKNTA